VKVIYETTMSAMCPVNDERDTYGVQIEATRQIMCEDILAVTRGFSRISITQEELTARLAQAFKAKVTTTGAHSHVRTFCTVDGADA
jgi:hypothetical protein